MITLYLKIQIYEYYVMGRLLMAPLQVVRSSAYQLPCHAAGCAPQGGHLGGADGRASATPALQRPPPLWPGVPPPGGRRAFIDIPDPEGCFAGAGPVKFEQKSNPASERRAVFSIRGEDAARPSPAPPRKVRTEFI